MHDLEEQERIDALKSWWERNGKMTLLALAAFAAALAAGQGWRYYQKTQSEQAAALYVTLQNVNQSRDTRKIRDAAGQLMDKYSGTPYAVKAALLAARVNYEAGDAKSAKAQLQWVVEHAREDELRDMARLRLAAILLDEKNYAEALTALEAKHRQEFSGLYADLKGDVLYAQGKYAEARAAYQLAADKSEGAYRQLIQMKLDALGG